MKKVLSRRLVIIMAGTVCLFAYGLPTVYSAGFAAKIKSRVTDAKSKRRAKNVEKVALAIEANNFTSVQDILDKVSPTDSVSEYNKSLFEFAVEKRNAELYALPLFPL